MAITYVSAAAIAEQPDPLKPVGNLTKTQVSVLAAQIAARVRQTTERDENGFYERGVINYPNDTVGDYGLHLCTESATGEFAIIANWYERYLGRPADKDGIEWWYNQIPDTYANAAAIQLDWEAAADREIAAGGGTGTFQSNGTPANSIGKYGLTVEQLEEAGYLKAGTSELVNTGGITVCELYRILSEISLWNCQQSLENFLASDQTPAVVAVMQNVAVKSTPTVTPAVTPTETAANILKAMYPDIDEETLTKDAEYAINLANNIEEEDITRPNAVTDTFNPNLTDVMQSIVGSTPCFNFTNIPKLPPQNCK